MLLLRWKGASHFAPNSIWHLITFQTIEESGAREEEPFSSFKQELVFSKQLPAVQMDNVEERTLHPLWNEYCFWRTIEYGANVYVHLEVSSSERRIRT